MGGKIGVGTLHNIERKSLAVGGWVGCGAYELGGGWVGCGAYELVGGWSKSGQLSPLV